MREILRNLFIIVFLLAHSLSVQGQSCKDPGGGSFDLVEPQGCVGKPVSVLNNVKDGDIIEYVYDFDKTQEEILPGMTRTYDTSHEYSKSGTYTILQWGSKGGGFTACKDVTVYETAMPNASLEVCKNGLVRLTLVDDAIYRSYDEIEIDWGGGDIRKVKVGGTNASLQKTIKGSPLVKIRGIHKNLVCDADVITRTLTGSTMSTPNLTIKISRIEIRANGTASITYEGVAGTPAELYVAKEGDAFRSASKLPDKGGSATVDISGLSPEEVHSFKLVYKDICGDPAESAVVHSMVLSKGTLLVDESNNLVWDPYTKHSDLLKYQILREEEPYSGNPELVYSGNDKLDYLDPQLKCGVKYRYTLLAFLDGNVASYSAPLVLQPTFSDPGVIKIAELSVEGNDKIASSIDLAGVSGLTTISNIIVERAVAGNANFEKISADNNTALTFTDNNVKTIENSYCYRYSWQNSCKVSSPPSDPICSILLTNNIKNISWTAASPFTNTVDSYDLLKTDASGASAGEIPKQLTTSHDVDLETEGNSSFQVRAQSGSMVSYSNVVSLRGDVIMLIPDIFTPNGDTHNDQFVVKSHFTNSFRMRIFSRWGEMVYQSENTTDGWDGNINGKPADGGYYIYKIDATTSENLRISKTGSLMLVR